MPNATYTTDTDTCANCGYRSDVMPRVWCLSVRNWVYPHATCAEFTRKASPNDVVAPPSQAPMAVIEEEARQRDDTRGASGREAESPEERRMTRGTVSGGAAVTLPPPEPSDDAVAATKAAREQPSGASFGLHSVVDDGSGGGPPAGRTLADYQAALLDAPFDDDEPEDEPPAGATP